MSSNRKLTAEEAKAFLLTEEGMKLIEETMKRKDLLASSPPQLFSGDEINNYHLKFIGNIHDSNYLIRHLADLKYERYWFQNPDDAKYYYKTRTLNCDNKDIKLHLTSTYSIPQSNLSLTDNLYILTYDVSNQESFEDSQKKLNEIRKTKSDVFCILLRITDSDRTCKVATSSAVAFAKQENISHFECTLSDYTSIETAIKSILQVYHLAKHQKNLAQQKSASSQATSSSAFFHSSSSGTSVKTAQEPKLDNKKCLIM